MAGIFISYRRDDTRHPAARLRRDLSDRFGSEWVFRDLDRIEPGVDFTEALKDALASCSVLVAMIGDRWSGAASGSSRRRIDEPDDWTAQEVAEAMRRGIRVIPLLVEGAEPLREVDLPERLRPLARLQALPLADARWEGDLRALVAVLERLPGLQRRKMPPSRSWLLGALALVALVIGVAAVLVLKDRAPAQAMPSEVGATRSTLPSAGDVAPAEQTLSRVDAMRGAKRGDAAAADPPNLAGSWRWVAGNERYDLVQDGRRFEIAVSSLDRQEAAGKGSGYLEDDRLRMVLGIRRGAIQYGNLECELTVSSNRQSMSGSCPSDKAAIDLVR